MNDTKLLTVTHKHTGEQGEYKIIATSEVHEGVGQDSYMFAIILGADLVHTGYRYALTDTGDWKKEALEALVKYVTDRERWSKA